MPRIARGLVDGHIYHVLNRGNGGQEIFHKEQDYKSFVDLMIEAKERFAVKLYAYCLMPNHFHLVLEPVQAKELIKWMQWLMTAHVRRYHRHYSTHGHVWQGRYKSFLIQQDKHLITVLRYVEGNPIRAGLVNQAGDWPWSSHKERVDTKSHLVDEVPVPLPDKWYDYVNHPLTGHELEKIRRSVIRQSPYGTPAWQFDVASKLGIESTLRPRGRPRKY